MLQATLYRSFPPPIPAFVHLVIIGNGITGVTCARLVRKRDPEALITMISEESDYFYSRTALMYIYMGHMTEAHTKPYADDFWRKNRIELVGDRVERIDTDAKELMLRDGEPVPYDALLIATGSTSTFYNWPGQDLDGVQGLYGLPDLEQMEQWTEGVDRAVVVGGGLIGVEMAEMLHVRSIHVTFLVREPWYMSYILPEEEGRMIERHLRAHGIDLRMETELKEILSDDAGRARAVVAGDGEEIPARFVGLTTGVQPNVGFLEGSGIETNRGVLIDRHFRTNVEGVYAAGDCAEFREPLPERKAIEQLWYTGREHGATVAQTITGSTKAYSPGVFYNSAKFFDIEYQTYGRIDPQLLEDEKTLYWEHPEGNRSIRIQYRANGSNAVVGVNLMGVRHRHAVWADWISKGADIETVLTNLSAANFDPEFFDQCEPAVLNAYNAENGTALEPASKKGWKRWMAKLPMQGNLEDRKFADSFSHLP
ncbi:MAG: FAD-dependent oxidoreductase [Rubricoccaceae bacterium]|nr:FAD-dependent oxidoreductase [Rubricoccaceae bacterium]